MTIRRNLIGGFLLASFVLASARVNALPPPPPITASKLAPVPSIFGNKNAPPTPRLRRKISIRNFQMVTPRSGWVLDTDRLSWYDESIATTTSIAPSGVDPDRIVALTIDATGSGVLAFMNDDERSISTMKTATFGKTWSATGVTSLTLMYSSFDIASSPDMSIRPQALRTQISPMENSSPWREPNGFDEALRRSQVNYRPLMGESGSMGARIAAIFTRQSTKERRGTRRHSRVIGNTGCPGPATRPTRQSSRSYSTSLPTPACGPTG